MNKVSTLENINLEELKQDLQHFFKGCRIRKSRWRSNSLILSYYLKEVNIKLQNENLVLSSRLKLEHPIILLICLAGYWTGYFLISLAIIAFLYLILWNSLQKFKREVHNFLNQWHIEKF